MNLTLLIAAHFMTGQSAFSGMAMTVGAAILRLFANKPRLRSAATILLLTGIVFVLASATPWPLWVYVLWLALAVTALPPLRQRWLRYANLFLLVALSVGLFANEIPYHISPRLNTADIDTIYVLGDSLSMGAEPLGKNWPELIQDASGIPVHRFAFGGATTRTALYNAGRIGKESALVLLEIGGNDLLGGNPTFHDDLERLLQSVWAPQRHVVMFELPLPPSCNRYGTAQRRLAKKYGVTLIPKKHLAAVLAATDATTDGLHLSVSGHKLLADHVLKLLD